jgi:hypothetical protein
MPYEDVPTENARPIPPRADEFTFTFNITDIHPDGKPYSTIDDLDLFSAETQTSNTRLLDYLDRIVTDVKIKGESTGPGVRGKGIPYPCLKRLMTGVGETIKRANDAGN